MRERERGNMHRKHVIPSSQLGCAKMEEHHRNAVQNLHCHTHRTIGRMRKLGKNQAIYYKTFHCVRTHRIFRKRDVAIGFSYVSLTPYKHKIDNKIMI